MFYVRLKAYSSDKRCGLMAGSSSPDLAVRAQSLAVFLDKTLYSHSASLYPGVKLGTDEVNVHLHLFFRKNREISLPL